MSGMFTPEFRSYVLARPDALFEKCIIYDGGARRYEIALHCEEVLGYWRDLLAAVPRTDWNEFLEEKAGHPLGIGFREWLSETRYEGLPGLEPLFEKERAFLENCAGRRLEDICRRRIAEFSATLSDYIKPDTI